MSQSKDGFRVVTDRGTEIVLAPKYANEIKNLDAASIVRQTEKVGGIISRVIAVDVALKLSVVRIYFRISQDLSR
jgi:hypothetical protein